MNKMVYEGWNGKESLVGVMETANWMSTKWCSGPKEKGFYLVSDGNGTIQTMGYDVNGKSLFESYMDGVFESARFSNGCELTDSDLIALYNRYHVWYIVSTGYISDYGEVEHLMIMSEEDEPRYFMEPKLRGPIDSELDTYDKTYEIGRASCRVRV